MRIDRARQQSIWLRDCTQAQKARENENKKLKFYHDVENSFKTQTYREIKEMMIGLKDLKFVTKECSIC